MSYCIGPVKYVLSEVSTKNEEAFHVSQREQCISFEELIDLQIYAKKGLTTEASRDSLDLRKALSIMNMRTPRTEPIKEYYRQTYDIMLL